MTLTERFAVAREHWIGRYIEALEHYKRKYSPGGPEVLLQLSDNGANPVFRLHRVDLASGATTPPNLTEVNVASAPHFDPERFDLERGIEVLVEPFHWNGAEFLVEGIAADDPELARWCQQWLDVEELNERDSHGLLQAIHSMTAPETREDSVYFSVDFGSAPVEAPMALLKLLSSIGATRVSVASRWSRTA